MSKRCYVCHETKPLEEFPKNKGMKDGHINKCKACTRAYNKTYDHAGYRAANRDRIAADQRARRVADPERDRAHTRKYRQSMKAVIVAAKAAGCVDCGVRLPPECMDLDHVRGEKLFTISQTSRFPGKDRMQMLKDEIAKCDTRCPNCHRLRHFREKQTAAA